MSKKKIYSLSVFIILCSSLCVLAQPVINIKPILGKHFFCLESTDLGYGVAKHDLYLERLNAAPTTIYLPVDVSLLVEGEPFSAPAPSGKLRINSQKTADGFLFIANGPQGNNLHLHFKKNASSNSSYSIEINLGQGRIYTFSIDYLLGQYLLIQGEASDYHQMIDNISSNLYFLEALSLLDNQFNNYIGDDQLDWWAQSSVGLFQDFVDVETIATIVHSAGFYSSFYDCSSQNAFCDIAWIFNDTLVFITLSDGDFLVINANQEISQQIILPTTGCSDLCAELVQQGYFDGDIDKCMACCHESPGTPGCSVGPGGGGGIQQCLDGCRATWYFCKGGCNSADLPLCMLNCSNARIRCETRCRL